MSTPLATYAETSQAEHQLSIDWEFTADGTPIGYDDGAQYDSIRSTITARLTPAQVQEVLACIRDDAGVCTIDGSGYLLGPTLNLSAGVPVRIVSLTQDQPADSSLALIDVTAKILHGPLPAPAGGSYRPRWTVAYRTPPTTWATCSSAWRTEEAQRSHGASMSDPGRSGTLGSSPRRRRRR